MRSVDTVTRPLLCRGSRTCMMLISIQTILSFNVGFDMVLCNNEVSAGISGAEQQTWRIEC